MPLNVKSALKNLPIDNPSLPLLLNAPLLKKTAPLVMARLIKSLPPHPLSNLKAGAGLKTATKLYTSSNCMPLYYLNNSFLFACHKPLAQI